MVQGAEGGYGTRVVTVNDVLDGHVALDVECVDRIYLNGCWRGLAREQRPAVTKALAGISWREGNPVAAARVARESVTTPTSTDLTPPILRRV